MRATRKIVGDRLGGLWLRAWLCAGVTGLGWGVVVAQNGESGVTPTAGATATGLQNNTELESAIAVLLAPDTASEQRTEAAHRLAAARTEGAIAGLGRALGADAPEQASLAVIGAISEAGLAGTMASVLVRACDDARGAVASAAGTALGGVPAPTREQIGGVVRAMARATTPGQRASVWSALVRMTGRDDLAPESGVWDTWWREHGFLPEGEWRVRQAASQASRAQRVARDRDALAARLGEAYSRVYALTPAEERSSMLAALLRDDSAQVRLIGFDLASRALVNAQALDAMVADAATQSLAGGSSDVRVAAARLLANLAPRDSAPALAALRAETDERVAAPLLRLLANRPDARETEVCLRWLERGDAVRPAAAEALASIHRVSALDAGSARRAVELLTRIEPARVSPSSARLLGTLSKEDDIESARGVFQGGENGARLALAEGLASHELGLSMLLEIAPQPDAVVFDLACRGAASRAASMDWFAMLSSAGAHLGEARWDGLARVLLAIPPEGFGAALSLVTDAQERSLLLGRAAAHAATNGGAAAARVGLARAEDAIARRDGGAALGLLDGVRVVPEDGSHRRARLLALLLLNRLDEAQGLNAPASQWLEALDLCRGLDHEAAIRDRISVAFEASLTAGERERLYAPGDPPENEAAPRETPESAGDRSPSTR